MHVDTSCVVDAIEVRLIPQPHPFALVVELRWKEAYPASIWLTVDEAYRLAGILADAAGRSDDADAAG